MCNGKRLARKYRLSKAGSCAVARSVLAQSPKDQGMVLRLESNTESLSLPHEMAKEVRATTIAINYRFIIVFAYSFMLAASNELSV